MKKLLLSGLVHDQIIHRVQAVNLSGPGADPWAHALMQAARMPADAREEDAIADALDAWICDISPETLSRSLRALRSAGERTCNPHAVDEMVRWGANPYALYVLSAVTDSSITVDHGAFENGQLCLLPHSDDHDEIMLPLTADVYWSWERILVRGGVVPETLLDGLVGRQATVLADHPLLRGVKITGIGDDVGGFRTIEVEAGPRVPWTDTMEEGEAA